MMEALLLLTLAMPVQTDAALVVQRDAVLPINVSDMFRAGLLCDKFSDAVAHGFGCVVVWMAEVESTYGFSVDFDDVPAATSIATVAGMENKNARHPQILARHLEFKDAVGTMGRYVPEPAGMLGCPAPQADADDRSSRVDLWLGIVSLSAAMIATGLTSSCLAANTCRETVPLTRWAFDRGPVWGVVGRAAVNGLIHYAVARWVPKGKWRTATLATLMAINVTNAALDIRTLMKIEREGNR